MGRLAIIAGCLLVLSGVAGCGKSDTTAPSTQDVADFKGHQPTADQMKQAMSRATQGGPPKGAAPAPASK